MPFAWCIAVMPLERNSAASFSVIGSGFSAILIGWSMSITSDSLTRSTTCLE